MNRQAGRPSCFRWAALLGMVALTGCVQPPKLAYHWESYPRQVYEFLNADSSTPGAQLQIMLAQAEKARATGATLPPGFRAHIGMLQLQLERPDEARQSLEAEKLAFPESTRYMDFLLAGMKGRKS